MSKATRQREEMMRRTEAQRVAQETGRPYVPTKEQRREAEANQAAQELKDLARTIFVALPVELAKLLWQQSIRLYRHLRDR